MQIKRYLAFLARYIFAAFSCIYLFTLGLFQKKHRYLINAICGHFGFFNRSSRFKRYSSELRLDTAGLDKVLMDELEHRHFARYAMYLDMMNFVRKDLRISDMKNPRILELGGSNHFMRKVFDHANYEVAENIPVNDIQDLAGFKTEDYDIVILEQVLEHVPDPWKAMEEIRRIIKKGGWLINSVPFMIKVHRCPADYWRFTKEGLEVMHSGFSEVIVKSWGTRDIAIEQIRQNKFVRTYEMREKGLFSLENDEEYPVSVWAYARK